MWGTGAPRREFMHTDDAAAAVLHLLREYDDDSTINIGTGEDVTIAELAATVADVVGSPATSPGTQPGPMAPPEAAGRLAAAGAGLEPQVALREGIRDTYAWYVAQRRVRRGESDAAEPLTDLPCAPWAGCHSGGRGSARRLRPCWPVPRRCALRAPVALPCTSPTPTRSRWPMTTPTLASSFNAADSVTFTDGVPVRWIGRRQHPDVAQDWDRVYGPDVMTGVLAASTAQGPRHYLLGGSSQTLWRCCARCDRRALAGRTGGGRRGPPFRPLSADEQAEVSRRIDASGVRTSSGWAWALPNGTGRSLGSRRPVRWWRWRWGCVRLPRRHEAAGPQWLQRAGLEWGYRLATGPAASVGGTCGQPAIPRRRMAGRQDR